MTAALFRLRAGLAAVPGVLPDEWQGPAATAAHARFNAGLARRTGLLALLDEAIAARARGESLASVGTRLTALPWPPAPTGGLECRPMRLAEVDAANRSALARALRTEGADAAALGALRDALAAPGRTLLHFAPTTGRAAVGIGDVAAAPVVTTFVPGTGAAPRTLSAGVDRAAALAQASGGAAVAWYSYDAPTDLFDAVDRNEARVGGPALAAFQDKLRGWRPDARLAVVGHSYGAAVVGDAAEHHMAADAVVLVGSPGVAASSAAALRHYELAWMTARDDPIALTPSDLHGKQPKALPHFGTHLQAPSGPGLSIASHSSYFDPGSASLAALAGFLHRPAH